jgi:hypothetical protein
VIARSARARIWAAAAAICTVAVASFVTLALLSTKDDPASRPDAARAAALPAPPAPICGNNAVLGGGPATPPPGAIRVRAGDNAGVNWGRPGATYWFAPGVHTLGSGSYSQIQPGRGATYVGAPGAILDGAHKNFYAFGGPAPDVRISYLEIRNFGVRGGNRDEGVVNKDSATGWTVDHSLLTRNAGAALMLSSGSRLTDNCLKDNQQYGFNAYSPHNIRQIVLTHNEITGNNTYNWESHVGECGCTGGGKFWLVDGAVIKDNWIHGNHGVGLWVDTNDSGFDITGNYFGANDSWGLIYEISYNARITGNTFVRNGLVSGPRSHGFPTGAIYLSESGSDPRVGGPFSRVFKVTGNKFIDNWGGVILWENSNRFCGSPANTSTGACTLVAPDAATVQSCRSSQISKAPLYGDCRWKTQNVEVSHNVFSFSPDAIGPDCTQKRLCGFQGIFSEYGSFPSWSPYMGTAVETHIAQQQNNRFVSNTYQGPWRFMIHQLGNVVPWPIWREMPYDQDTGSTMDPGTSH